MLLCNSSFIILIYCNINDATLDAVAISKNVGVNSCGDSQYNKYSGAFIECSFVRSFDGLFVYSFIIYGWRVSECLLLLLGCCTKQTYHKCQFDWQLLVFNYNVSLCMRRRRRWIVRIFIFYYACWKSRCERRKTLSSRPCTVDLFIAATSWRTFHTASFVEALTYQFEPNALYTFHSFFIHIHTMKNYKSNKK